MHFVLCFISLAGMLMTEQTPCKIKQKLAMPAPIQQEPSMRHGLAETQTNLHV